MSKRNPKGRAPAAPMIESLESRELLSGSHSVSATRLTFSTTAASGAIANPIGVTVAAKLTANGLPLRTANIFFVIDGKTSIGEAQTGRSGYATANVPNLPAGTHTFAAYFTGATRYVASQSRATTLKETIPAFTTTASGLQYATITAGSGAATASGNLVHVNYVGYLTDGTLFDTSIGRAANPSDTQGNFVRDGGFTLATTLGTGGVIAGFDEGLTGMKVGETRVLVIPPSLGYGSNPNGNIPANSTLVFYVKMEAFS